MRITDLHWIKKLFDCSGDCESFNKRLLSDLKYFHSFQYHFAEPLYICVVLGKPYGDGYCYLLATSIIYYGELNLEELYHINSKNTEIPHKNLGSTPKKTEKLRATLIKQPQKEIVEEKPEPAEVEWQKKKVIVKKKKTINRFND